MEIIELLRKERQSLVERLKVIDKMLCQFEDLGRNAEALLTRGESSTKVTDSHVPVVKFESGVAAPTVLAAREMPGLARRAKTSTEEFERVVIDILREADAPMDRAQLYDALTKRGVVIGDGDRNKELNALSARVYRMAQAGHLENKRGRGYQLKPPETLGEAERNIVSEGNGH